MAFTGRFRKGVVQIPRDGGYTLSDIRSYIEEVQRHHLRSPEKLRALVRAAGVELRWHPDPRIPYRYYEPFTPEEAERILSLFWQRRGKALLSKKK